MRRCTGGIFVLSAAYLAVAAASHAQTFTVIKRFNGSNGDNPEAALVQGRDGNLYGTTYNGGINNNGTVFRITSAGAFKTLYKFCANFGGCLDGSGPAAGLVLATDGNFYGITQVGGANSLGVMYKINSKGQYQVIYNFCPLSGCPDGAQPLSGLVQGSDGIFYGTAQDGGANGNFGTVYAITPSGSETTLHSFCQFAGCTDGGFPVSVLVQGADGNLYGSTGTFGANQKGTVFEITPGGGLTTLYSFCALSNCLDGWGLRPGVVAGNDGNFYGVTGFGGGSSNCGPNTGCGTVFKVTPNGVLTTLHTFSSSDGAFPVGLVLGSDGNFYGATSEGGTFNKGVFFEITPAGVFNLLHTFLSGNAATPSSPPVQLTDGNFYGVSSSGSGSIYKLSTGLAPFVKTVPIAAPAKTAVRILGTNLTGATSVTFNGVAAAFTVSATQISTKVPVGATSGPVQVVTPGGTLTSNAAFQVLP